MPFRSLTKLCPLLLLVMLSACGGGGGKEEVATAGPAAAATPSSPPDTMGTVFGRVLDSRTEAPLAGARVTAAGKTVFTGPDGSYLLENLPLARVVVAVSAAGHAEQVSIAELNSHQGRQWVILRPLAVDASLAFDASQPQTLAAPASPARVTLPANALVLANGLAPAGNVTAAITGIDPGADPGAMPGDYRTDNGTLQSYGAINVSFRDAAGQPLNLAAGRTATIRIPVASGLATLPATSPLYWFNVQSGLWVREGQATLVGSGAGAYYEGVVSHFTTWNADDVMNTVQLSGRVTDENGAGVAGVQVGSLGVDYAGIATSVTDASGNFTLAVKANATARVLALLNDVESQVQQVGPRSSNFSLTTPLILTSSAGARLSLGTPVAVENLGITPHPCCRYFNVRLPFTTNGPRLPFPTTGNVVNARWEWRHAYAQALATPEVVCGRDDNRCTVDGVDTPIQTAGGLPYMTGDFEVRRVDTGTGATSGTVEFLFSAHVGGFAPAVTPTSVTFTAVLVMDVTDPITARTVTVRSEPRQITVPLAAGG